MPTSGDEKSDETDKPDKSRGDTPVYAKPKLRRYDQIEQVKPYGPSERKAG
jgi:hypothetical protein